MKSHNRFIFTLALLIVVAIAAPILLSQTLTSGDLTGTITDPSGAVIPNAKVTLKSNDQGFTKTATTNANGFYRFSLLPPGSYNVSVAVQGFQNYSTNTNVSVGAATSLNARLALSTAGTTVEVTAAPGVVQTETGNIATTFSTQQVEQVPNPGNDLSYIAQTAPGAVMNTGAGYGNFSTFGLPATSNLFTFNGMNENDPFFNLNNSGATNLLLGGNEVREVSVVNNGYSVQYGGLAGANVNYVSKSGSNSWHGNAQYFFNYDALNANEWFNNNAGTRRPSQRSNQWAGSLGGPIIKDKTFFFIDQEGLYVTLPTSILTKVPSPQFITATLGNVPAAQRPFYQQMFNLYQNAPGYSSATPVAGGGCNSAGTAFSANSAFGGAGVPCALQFRANPSNKTHEWILSARVDQNIGSKDRVFLRFKTDHGVQASYTDPINPAFDLVSDQPQYEGQLNHNHTFGTNTVNQLILSGSWYSAVFSEPNLQQALQLMPFRVGFSGNLFYSLGRQIANSPQGRNVTQYGINDDVTHTRGNHTLKFGVQFVRNNITDYNPGILSNGYSFGQSLADFYSGISTNYQQGFPTRLTAPLALYGLSFYGQDDWKVRPNLTLTMGLRADHNSNPVCQIDCFARFPTSFEQLNHGINTPYNQSVLFNQHQALNQFDKVNWQPRFGFAWSPFGSGVNTVIRGGFGIFIDRFPGVVADSLLGNPPFNPQFLNAGQALGPIGLAGSAPAVAAGANTAFQTAFASGGTFPTIAASNPFFALAPPSFFSPAASLHSPQFQEWSFEVQQGLGQNSSFTLKYVGNHGIHEAYFNQGLNTFDPTGFGGLPTGIPFTNPGVEAINGGPVTLGPDPRFSIVNEARSDAVSNYNGLTATLQRRLRSFQFQVNYTWSHALDEISNGGQLPFIFNTNTSILSPQNPFNLRANYGNADYDIRHYLSLNYVWDVPFKFQNGFLNQALGGWVISGTVFAHTGLPYTIIDAGATSTLGGQNYGTTFVSVFANQNVGGTFNCGASWITTPCPSMANNFSPVTTTFGNQRRNQIFGPRFFDTDLSVMKNFKIPGWESGRLGVGAQMFNILNHPNFDQPVADVTDSSYGTIINTVSPPTTIYGAFVGAAASPRIIQLKANLTF